ncbi:chromobox protein [Holotrichia oblita]|uniref:Chromobox protein n=1 Tax=Holotrichia oblita TaxID=644536 RepID=A0ACB9TAR1_HOLOL|nr:chromobox protein [Holotrichia oblita]
MDNGRVDYLLKWKNYSGEDNSWEPEDNLDCPELIRQFEKLRRTNKVQGGRDKKRRKSPSPINSDASEASSKDKQRQGRLRRRERRKSKLKKKKSGRNSDEGESDDDNEKSKIKKIDKKKTDSKNDGKRDSKSSQAEKIIGASDTTGELLFLMKCKGTDDADLVPAKKANVVCPQVIIQFYEDHLAWHSPEEDQ